MRLTRRSEYAILAMLYLARHADEGNVPLSRLAEAQGIPIKFLEHIVVALSRAGYLTSQKGQHGGHRLARDPGTITLAEIIRFFDGALAPVSSVSRFFYQATPIEKEPKMLEFLREIRDWISNRLETTTLADVL
jgi:Rrf2 family transcriptional regulator, cysteine metabolism repressor